MLDSPELRSDFTQTAKDRVDALFFARLVERILQRCNEILLNNGLDVSYHPHFSTHKTEKNNVIFDSETPATLEPGTVWCSILRKERNIFRPMMQIWAVERCNTALFIESLQDTVEYSLSRQSMEALDSEFEAYLLGRAGLSEPLSRHVVPAGPM